MRDRISQGGATALVTGASRGIGSLLARDLAAAGVTVVGVARSGAQLDAVFGEVCARSPRSRSYEFDLARIAALPDLVSRIEAEVGRIDVLINNAGVDRWGALRDLGYEAIRRVFDVNLFSAMELTRLVLPGMLAAGRGRVVNVASMSGRKADPYNAPYSASKAAMIRWSDALRQELHGTGVAVSLVTPGPVATGMFEAHGGELPRMASACDPANVTRAVRRAIDRGEPEVLVNAGMAPVLWAICEFFPGFGDWMYRRLGVPALNAATSRRMAEREADARRRDP